MGRFAYVILAHHRLHQVVRLVERLSTARSVFFVHVDLRTSDEQLAELADLRDRPDVHLVERWPSPWARFGLVEATIAGLRAAVSDPDVGRVTLLSGQDYPIKPVRDIESFFDSAAESAFVEHFPLPREGWGGRGGAERFEDLHLWPRGRHVVVPMAKLRVPRRPPGGRRPYQGGQYFSLDRRSCVELLDAIDGPVRRFYARTHVPDEMFFQTVLLSSPAAPRVVNDDLRLEVWGTGSHPRILTLDDLPTIVASDRLVAKKFDDSVDGRILDAIDREILGR